MATIFTYGSLMCQDIMSRVAGLEVSAQVGSVDGFRRYAIVGEAFPGVVAEPGARLWGQVYTGLSEAALRRLDSFEGPWYLRMAVQVTLENRSRLGAETYVMRPQYQHHLADWEWDFDHFMRHGKANFMRRYAGYERI